MDMVKRRSALLEWLQSAGRVDVAEAALRFDTAEMTIRRDLDALVAQGATGSTVPVTTALTSTPPGTGPRSSAAPSMVPACASSSSTTAWRTSLPPVGQACEPRSSPIPVS